MPADQANTVSQLMHTCTANRVVTTAVTVPNQVVTCLEPPLLADIVHSEHKHQHNTISQVYMHSPSGDNINTVTITYTGFASPWLLQNATARMTNLTEQNLTDTLGVAL